MHEPGAFVVAARLRLTAIEDFGAPRFLRQFVARISAGKTFRNAIQGGGPFVSGALLFRAFDLFPLHQDGIGGFELVFAEHVRMAVDQFVDDPRQTCSKSNAPRSLASWQ